LRHLPNTKLEKLPRMADFALWATACEGAFWEDGTFWRAYAGNRDQAVDSVIEADPVGSAVRSLMMSRTLWTGTATDLLDALTELVGEKVGPAKAWPQTARALSGRLRRAATTLRAAGIDISFEQEGRARTRTVRISCVPENGPAEPSLPSAPSAYAEEPNWDGGLGAAPPRTVAPSVDADGVSASSTVHKNPSDSEAADGADGRDARDAPHSDSWRARI